MWDNWLRFRKQFCAYFHADLMIHKIMFLYQTLQSHTSLTRFHYQFSPFNQAFVIICDDFSAMFFLPWWELKRIPYGDSLYLGFAIFIQNLLFKSSRNVIVINRDLQQKHPFLMVNIVLRVHVVRMVLKHPPVDKQIIQQAGPFQRRDRYSHLKQIWYYITRLSICLSTSIWKYMYVYKCWYTFLSRAWFNKVFTLISCKTT